MERELFDYNGWDGSPSYLTYFHPILKVQVGEFPPGTSFAYASMGPGYIRFFNYEEERISPITGKMISNPVLVAEYRLHYRIGEKVA